MLGCSPGGSSRIRMATRTRCGNLVRKTSGSWHDIHSCVCAGGRRNRRASADRAATHVGACRHRPRSTRSIRTSRRCISTSTRIPSSRSRKHRTAATLAARVKALGFDVTTGVGRTGIVAVMKNGPGPTVMLRTELDALPVEEKTGLPFASHVVVTNSSGQKTPVTHACGHDLHMSAWAGTARVMAEHRDRWSGTLVMVGQPAEEGGGGAAAMSRTGCSPASLVRTLPSRCTMTTRCPRARSAIIRASSARCQTG